MTPDEGPPVPNHHWRAGPVPPGRAVVFDLDGVLSDAAGRQHFLAGGRRDWDGFFQACGDDPLGEDVAGLLGLLDPAVAVVLLTARPAAVRAQTLAWLARHDLRWDLLIMRRARDFSPSVEFKRRSVGELRAAGLEPVLGFDDDRRNVDMFRDLGIPCVYIHSGYYD